MLNNLDNLIKNAIKQKDKIRLSVLRAIKSEFSKREHNGEEMTEKHKLDIISKMISQHKDSISQYEKCNRTDLVDSENAELAILLEFAPKEISVEDAENIVKEALLKYQKLKGDEYKITLVDLKNFIKIVNEEYPNISNGTIANIFKNEILLNKNTPKVNIIIKHDNG